MEKFVSVILLLYLLVQPLMAVEEHGDHYFHNDNESSTVAIEHPTYQLAPPPSAENVEPTTSRPPEQILCPPNRCSNDTTDCYHEVFDSESISCVCNIHTNSMNCTHVIYTSPFGMARNNTINKIVEFFCFLMLGVSIMVVTSACFKMAELQERSISPYIIRYTARRPSSSEPGPAVHIDLKPTSLLSPRHRLLNYLRTDSIINPPQVSQPTTQPSTDNTQLNDFKAGGGSMGNRLKWKDKPRSSEIAYEPLKNLDVESAGESSPSISCDDGEAHSRFNSKLNLKRLCNNKLLKVDKKTLKYLIDEQLPKLDPSTVYGRMGRNCISDIMSKQSPTIDVYSLPLTYH